MASTDATPRSDPTPPPHASPRLETLRRFGIVMAALIALAAFPQSALFTVDRIEVAGAEGLAPEVVAEIAGLRHGERLFAVDSAGALQRLRADPRIRAADVQVKPPRTVSVRIAERRPVVALAVGAQFAVLGDDLVVVSVGPSGHGVPEVVDRIRPVPWTRAGAPVASRAAQIAIAVLPAIPGSLRADLARIVVSPGPDLTLVLQSGLEIRAGGPSGIAERLAEVPQVLAALHARGQAAAALDLRYAGSIAVTLATGGEAR